MEKIMTNIKRDGPRQKTLVTVTRAILWKDMKKSKKTKGKFIIYAFDGNKTQRQYSFFNSPCMYAHELLVPTDWQIVNTLNLQRTEGNRPQSLFWPPGNIFSKSKVLLGALSQGFPEHGCTLWKRMTVVFSAFISLTGKTTSTRTSGATGISLAMIALILRRSRRAFRRQSEIFRKGIRWSISWTCVSH